MNMQKSRQWLRLMCPKQLYIIKATKDNIKLDKDEKNNGANHGNERSVIEQIQKIFIFELAK